MALAPNNSGDNPDVGSTPPKLPSWISEALIRRRLEIWNPRYGFTLTREDAIEMLVNLSRLFGTLSRNGCE
jgi:hypothetical protein